MNPNYKTTSTSTITTTTTTTTNTNTNTSFPSMGHHFGHQPSRSDMRCRVGITIPACSLELSLNSHDSDLRQGQLSHKRSMDGSDWSLIKAGELTCCSDCSAKLDVEIRSNHGATTSSPTTTSSFPSWLYKQENSTRLSTTTNNHDQDHLQYVRDLFKKWNSICNSLHKNHHKTLNFSLMTSPSTSTTSSHDHIHQNEDSIIRSPSIDKEGHHLQRFKEFNTENLKSLCNSLERAVPWQSELAPEIAGAVLQCRSGMMRRRAKSWSGGAKEDTWLLFQGRDVEGKEKVCRELARVVFGSRSKLTSIHMSSISAMRADSMEDMKNKRARYNKSSSLLERFVEAVRYDPHRVFMVEDVEQVDYSWWLSLKRSIECGKVCDSNGEEVAFGDAIVVLSCESFDSSSRACSPVLKQKRYQLEEEMVEGEEGSFDLNLVVEDHGDGGFPFDGGVGLIEMVDRCFFFNLKEDL
ncbi:hypothetical protein QJS10_CPB19g00458 [Acorus calamus]|uniref:Uncharacterized protein n=1 Tax=Acorus calamus TaxID=4465 RepID=A0AAV9CFM8_ACOCL|nr:hypothetical protein QJS10_CPB19g00458 [Acorus calamus]